MKYEINGTGRRFTSANKALGIREWIRGIRAGTLQERIATYYDQVEEIDPDFPFGDPSRMSRIEQLQHIKQLQNFINEKTAAAASSQGGANE